MRLGRFELLEPPLGQGGMGIVYKGWDPSLERPVAIKQLTQVTNDYLERFRQEARAAGRLLHANITTVFEYGDDGEVPFLVMEYLDGHDLRTLMRRGRLPDLSVRLDAIRQVCLGLDYAHEQGVVAHRDIKPANIQITSSGIVKIMDFGIAKLASEIQLGRSLTEANTVLGTLHYLAPEQIRGEPLDGRCDIWATGVVLYELLYGCKPFDDEDDGSLMTRIVLEELAQLPVLRVRHEEALQQIVRRALEKDRDRRYSRARELASDIGLYLRLLEDSKAIPALKVRSAEQYLQEASALHRAGLLVRAMECCRKALEMAPGDAVALDLLSRYAQEQRTHHMRELYKLGMLSFRQKEYEVAAGAFEALLALDPGNTDASTIITWSRRQLSRREERTSLIDIVDQALGGSHEEERREQAAAPASFEDAPTRRDQPLLRPVAPPAPGEPTEQPELQPVGVRDRSTSRVSSWFRKLLGRD